MNAFAQAGSAFGEIAQVVEHTIAAHPVLALRVWTICLRQIAGRGRRRRWSLVISCPVIGRHRP